MAEPHSALKTIIHFVESCCEKGITADVADLVTAAYSLGVATGVNDYIERTEWERSNGH